MSEVENEKDYKLLKIITIIIIYFVIGIVAMFTFCVSKVNAALNYRTILNNSWSEWQTANLNTDYTNNTTMLTSWQSKVQLKDTFAFRDGNKYDFIVTGTWQIIQQGDRAINFGIQPAVYNGSSSVDQTEKCQVTQTTSVTHTGSGSLERTIKTLNWSITCSGIFGNGYYPYMSFLAYSSYQSTAISTFRVNSRYYEINSSSTDSDKIKEAINNATSIINNTMNTLNEALVNNNNYNSDRIIESNQQTQQSVDDLNDSITDSSIDNPSNALNGMNNYFGSNGVVSDLLLLPVRMFQSIVNTIDGTCSPFNLGVLLGHQLTMPCINLSSRLGSALYGVIDVLISGFFILSIRKKFVDIFEHFTSLKMGGNELE